MQRLLIALNYNIGPPDGNFGLVTEIGVRKFQADHGLTVDGKVGNKTIQKMRALVAKSKMNVSSSKPSGQLLEDIKDEAKASDPTGGIARLRGVMPDLAIRVRKCIEFAADEGVDLRVSQGFRTAEQQRELFERRPRVTMADSMQSMHNYGLAADFYIAEKGKAIWTVSKYNAIGIWAGRAGLEWGGNFRSMKDRPHVQWPGLKSYRPLLAEYEKHGGGDAGVKAVWEMVNPG